MRPVVSVQCLELSRAVDDSRDRIMLPSPDLRADPGGAWGMNFEALAGDPL